MTPKSDSEKAGQARTAKSTAESIHTILFDGIAGCDYKHDIGMMTDLIESYATEYAEAQVQECLAECMKIDEKTSKDCYAEGYKAGQIAMRERAAKWADERDVIRAAQIRSLSIDDKHE